jgi:hypothetical protein
MQSGIKTYILFKRKKLMEFEHMRAHNVEILKKSRVKDKKKRLRSVLQQPLIGLLLFNIKA